MKASRPSRAPKSPVADRSDARRLRSARSRERLFAAMLDALGTEVAVLDGSGTILAVNRAWRDFAEANGGDPEAFGAGANYFAVCDAAEDGSESSPALLAAGIRDVLAGLRDRFEWEYPCHTPTRERWFLARVTPLRGNGPARVVIAHEDVTERVLAEREALESKRKVVAILESVSDAFLALDGEWRFTYANSQAERLGGKSAEEMIGRVLWDVFPEAAGTVFEEELRAAMESGAATRFEAYYAPIERWLSVHVYPSAGGLSVYFTDATQRKRLEAEREQRAAEYRLLAEYSTDAISRHDREGRYLYVSPASVVISGRTSEELLGRSPYALIHPDDIGRMRELHDRLLQSDETGRVTFRLRQKDDQYSWLETTFRAIRDPATGEVVEIQGCSRDANERVRTEAELRRQNERLAELATLDPLTGLSNRRHLWDRLVAQMTTAERRGEPLSVIMLDVDHFKKYNDSYGHPAGDEVLIGVADLLRGAVRGQDLVARYGGEEFAVLAPDSDAHAACTLADRLRTAIARAGWRLRPVTASLGVATRTEAPWDPALVLDEADQALYRSKRLGRNRVLHYGG